MKSAPSLAHLLVMDVCLVLALTIACAMGFTDLANAAVIYTEDFNNVSSGSPPPGWKLIPGFDQAAGATWRVVDGVFRIQVPTNGNLGIAVDGLNLPDSYEITLRARLVESRSFLTSSDQLLVFSNLTSFTDPNAFLLTTGWRQNESNDFFLTGRAPDNLGHILKFYNFEESRWHSIRIVRKGTSLRTFINGDAGLDVTLGANRTGGTIGLQIAHGTYEIDDIVVRSTADDPVGGMSGGPAGTQVVALAIDPRTARVLYASTESKGVFKTTTEGGSWAPAMNGLVAPATTLAIDPQNTAILYAGTKGGGIFKSTDGGVSWRSRNGAGTSGLPPEVISSVVQGLVIDPSAPATVYVGIYRDGDKKGLYKSTDGGASWRQLRPFDHLLTLAIDPRTPTTLYVATVEGLFKSTDGGDSFSPSNSGLQVLQLQVPQGFITALAIAPATPLTLYVGTSSTIFPLFKTSNGGASWVPSSTGLPNDSVISLAIDPRTPTTLYAGTKLNGVFKSVNGGESWSQSDPSTREVRALTVVIDAAGFTTVYSASSSGISKSTNGGRWVRSNAGLATSPVLAMALDPLTPATIYAGRVGDLFKSTNGGGGWTTPINAGLTDTAIQTMAIDSRVPATLYAGTGSGVFRSTNGGDNWEASTALPPILALAIDPQTPATLYAGTGSGVFKSTNGGVSWEARSTGLPSTSILALAIDPQTPATLYAGTDRGVFKSANAGVTWNLSSIGLPVDRGPFRALAVDPLVPSILYVGGDAGLFQSANRGDLWNPTGPGLPSTSVNAIAIDPTSPTNVYAGLTSGLFTSTNRGATWNPMQTNLAVFSVLVDPSGTCVHAGTDVGVLDFTVQGNVVCTPPPPTLDATLSATILSVPVETPAQTFVVVENLSGGPAAGEPGAETIGVTGLTCGITQLTGAQTLFSFQAVDPINSQPIEAINTPVNIDPGSSQKFLLKLTPLVQTCPLDIQFAFNCTNSKLAPIKTGVNTLLLTAGPAGGSVCGLSAAANTSQTTFTVGQTLIAGASITNPGDLPGAADIYVGILRPDNSVEFVTTAGTVVGNLSDPSSARPLAVNVSLTPQFSVSQSALFTHQWVAGDLRGFYVFFIAAVRAGALASDQILRLATALYSFP